MADYQTIRTGVGARAAQIDQGLRAHMNKVYSTMSVGMLITALAAWAIAGLATTTDATSAAAQLPNGTMLTAFGAAIYGSALRWVIMFGPLAFILFGWGALMRRAPAAGVQLGFFVFAAAIGLSLSSIFLVYTSYSIAQTFIVTAIAFAGLSLFGYTTRRNLSGMGTFLIMGVIGLIVASIVNIFLQSSGMQFAISLLGVLIFAGLTAYDTQNIKNTYLRMAGSDQDFLGKAAIMGALQLYLDFLNLFMFLLQFLGNRD